MLCEFYFNKKQREKVRRWSIDDSTWLDHNTADTATAKSLQSCPTLLFNQILIQVLM